MDLSAVFKSYDIRGIFPGQLNEEFAELLGKALVSHFKCKEIGIARDMRKSGERLHSALVKGIVSQGCNVLDFGLCTTDEFYFCIARSNLEAGAMITASHNPKEYNGFKITGAKAKPLDSKSGLPELKKLVQENTFRDSEKKGTVKKKTMLSDFIDECMGFIDSKKIKPLKIVVDFGNGMGSLTVPKALERLPVKPVFMFEELDGSFPNHEANPLKPEACEDAEKKVLEEKADLGILFDGDGDRCAFVDDRGKKVPGDFISALLAKQVLQKKKGTVIKEPRSSKFVDKVVEENGGKMHLTRVGHSFFKRDMKQHNAVFAGELSGHYYYDFGDFVSDNALVSALKILELVSVENKSLSGLVAGAEKHFFLSGEINSDVKDKEAKMKELEEHYKGTAKKIFRIDGLSIEFENWWFNVRPSGTEPLLRLNLEANSKKLMGEKLAEVLKIIRG